MKALSELLQDDNGRVSISRVMPLLTFLVMLALVAGLSIYKGSPADIPSSWLEFLLITVGGYGVAKGLNLGLGQKGDTNAP